MNIDEIGILIPESYITCCCCRAAVDVSALRLNYRRSKSLDLKEPAGERTKRHM